MFLDNSFIAGCISEDNKEVESTRRLMKSLVTWCNNSHLRVNISKTNELVEGYQWNSRRSRVPVFTQSEEA